MAKSSSNQSVSLRPIVWILVAAVVVLGIGLWYTWSNLQSVNNQLSLLSPQLTSASYSCDSNKSIQAQLFDQKAELELSDGRSFLLMQGVSGSGVRFTNSDETITFWIKGNGSFLEEGPNTTYNNCVTSSN